MRWKSLGISLLIVAAVATWMSQGNIGNDAVREAAARKEAKTDRNSGKTSEAFLVDVVESRSALFRRYIRLNARTRARRTSVLTAELEASVIALPHRDGDRVRAGDVLVRLSENARHSAYASAKGRLARSAKNLTAMRKLSQEGYQSELELLRAEEEVLQAQQNVLLAEQALENMVIIAPYDGIVQEMMVEFGDNVRPNSTMVRLIDLDPLEVVSYVSEREWLQVHLGQTAEIALINGETLTGSVEFIAPSSDVRTGTFEVRIALPNPDMRLPAGISATMTIFTGDLPAHFHSKSILTLNNRGQIGIKAVSPDNTVMFHPVDILEDASDGVYLGALPDVLTLIVSGQDFVKPGTLVRTQIQNANSS